MTELQSLLPDDLRPDLRKYDELRQISFQLGIAPHALGSVLVSFGNTKVICAATFEKKVPQWMVQQGIQGGWITAEYSLLPYSTHDRKPREISKNKPDGRTIEIQRLIGRSLRAVLDLQKIPGYTLWLDCDVLQADGGTRVAAISGAYVAAQMAIKKMIEQKIFPHNPLKEPVAAVSVAILNQNIILDPSYVEDKEASMDCNVVMTGSEQMVELQASGEEATFSKDQLSSILQLATASIQSIIKKQQAALDTLGSF